MRALGFRLALTRVFEVADMGDCLAERGLEVGDVNWLGQEVERAPANGRADIGHVAIGGDDHGGNFVASSCSLASSVSPSMRGMLISETTMSKSPWSASRAKASTPSRANPNAIEPSLI